MVVETVLKVLSGFQTSGPNHRVDPEQNATRLYIPSIFSGLVGEAAELAPKVPIPRFDHPGSLECPGVHMTTPPNPRPTRFEWNSLVFYSAPEHGQYISSRLRGLARLADGSCLPMVSASAYVYLRASNLYPRPVNKQRAATTIATTRDNELFGTLRHRICN